VSDIAIDHEFLRDAITDGLSRISEMSWTRAADGTVRSERAQVIHIADLHPEEDQHPGHVDIGFGLNAEHPGAPVLWDCVAGIGNTPAQVAEQAAFMWLETTAPAVLELMEQRSRLADHHESTDPGGLPGMHVVQGPALVFGRGDTTPMQEWARDNYVLPALYEALSHRLSEDINGVKLLFGGRAGGEVAEVRVNQAYDEASSRTLAQLAWPRLEGPAFVRAYLVVMPSDS
jgi:hypothetical protein